MSIQSAINELNTLWDNINRKQTISLVNIKIWHSGIVDLNNFSPRNSVLWVTKDSEAQDYYNSWAKSDAKKNNLSAFKNELMVQSSLILADFEKHHFHTITETHLEGKHSLLNEALYQFCMQNKLDGILRTTGGELALIQSIFLSKLKIIQQQLL